MNINIIRNSKKDRRSKSKEFENQKCQRQWKKFYKNFNSLSITFLELTVFEKKLNWTFLLLFCNLNRHIFELLFRQLNSFDLRFLIICLENMANTGQKFRKKNDLRLSTRTQDSLLLWFVKNLNFVLNIWWKFGVGNWLTILFGLNFRVEDQSIFIVWYDLNTKKTYVLSERNS